jgi:hypothetical protein
MHGEMAKNYSKMGVARHCAALEKDYKAAAKQNLALAAIHHKLAQEAAK